MPTTLFATHPLACVVTVACGARRDAADLGRMYRMVHRLEDKDGIVPMCRYMRDHVIKIGMEIVKEQVRHAVLARRISSLHTSSRPD